MRDDALATLTEADGDVSALRVDSTGRVWCNVSNTVTVGADDWDEVAEYIWRERESFTGVSLLAATGDKDFAFAPNEEIVTPADEARWNALLADYTPVDYTTLVELDDTTTLSGEAACAGGACLIG